MNARTEKLLSQALELPNAERAELAAELIASLNAETDAGVEQAWEAEIARRVEELESGAVTAIPGEDVQHRLRERLDDPHGLCPWVRKIDG